MRLTIKQGGKTVQELVFKKGPIYIGRQMGSQVFLAEKSVSRQHAVIYASKDREWVIEDLDSSNKTYLNNKAIHKSSVNEGDIVSIGPFTIEVYFKTSGEVPTGTHMGETMMGDTLTGDAAVEDMLSSESIRSGKVIRNIESKHTPIILPTRRFKDFTKAASSFAQMIDIENLHKAALELLIYQFSAAHVWSALRTTAAGPMICEGGKKSSTEMIHKSSLAGQQTINEAMDKHEYILLPQIWKEMQDSQVRSIITAPVIMGQTCFGVLYADNSLNHEQYDTGDLDYLIILSTLLASMIENMRSVVR